MSGVDFDVTRKQNNADAADATAYTCDASDRLTQMVQTGSAALTASYTYDVFGRRIQSTITRAAPAGLGCWCRCAFHR